MRRWKKQDWAFLYWTQVPPRMAVMQNDLGDTLFIDAKGTAWKGPTFSRADPVPLEQYPPLGDDYLVVT